MSAQAMDIEYTDFDAATAWPLRPWGESEAVAAGGEAGPVAVPAVSEPAPVVRKSRDRGASAVEWVVITAIVVAIVTGVGVLIKNAITTKTDSTTKCIQNSDTACSGNK
jgi:Flp pilus assembly pilin Flp